MARVLEPGEPRILANSGVVYRRGGGKGMLKNTRAVRVCEDCLALALAGSIFPRSVAGDKFWTAIRESLSEGYRALLDGDK